MRSDTVVDRDAVTAAFDAVDRAVDGIAAVPFDALTTREWFALLERCERLRRRLPSVEHDLINQLARQATPEELGGRLSHALAERLLISRAEAARRINEAVDLGQRHGLTGEPLAPLLDATAAGQREGKLGAGQVAVIRRSAISCRAGWIPRPAKTPKHFWPSWARSFGPSNWARSPIGSPIA